MDINCEKCNTEYSLDETLVSPTGTSVRCTNCNHVFKAFPANAISSKVRSSNTLSAHSFQAKGSQANSSHTSETWILRQPTGSQFPFDTMGVLQKWIAKGKVSKEDQLSKSGGKWKKIGDIAELRAFFDDVQLASQHTQLSNRVSSSPIAAGFPSTHRETGRLATIRTISAKTDEKPRGVAPKPQAAQFIRYVAADRSTNPPSPISNIDQKDKQPPLAKPIATAENIKVSSKIKNQASFAETVVSTSFQSDTMNQDISLEQTMLAPNKPTKESQATKQMGINSLEQKSSGSSKKEHTAAYIMSKHPLKQTRITHQQSPAIHQQNTQNQLSNTTKQEPDLSQIPASTASDNWKQGKNIKSDEPAWINSNKNISTSVEREFEHSNPSSKKTFGRWIILLIIILLVGSGFYLFAFEKELIQAKLGQFVSSPDSNRHQSFFLKGQENFLLDTETSFFQADREYHKVLALYENHPSTLAALAEMHTVWAQYILDAEIDARVNAQNTAALNENLEKANPDFSEADKLHQKFDEKLSEAKQWIDRAFVTNSELAVANLAMADWYRLKGEKAESKAHLDKGRSLETTAQATYLSALIAIDEGTDNSEIIGILKSAISTKPLIRALYREARVLAANKNFEAANNIIKTILSINSKHLQTHQLSKRIKENQNIILSLNYLASSVENSAQSDTRLNQQDDANQIKLVQSAASDDSTGEKIATINNHEDKKSGGVENEDRLLKRAVKLQQNGNSTEALKLFNSVLESKPFNIDALSGIAYCYLDKGQRGLAISHFRRALKANRNFGPAQIGLAQTYKSQGQNQQALVWFEKYIAFHTSGAQANLAKRNIDQIKSEIGQNQPEKTTASANSADAESKNVSATSTPDSVNDKSALTSKNKSENNKPPITE